MFAAFIDYQKAYDRVDSDILWSCLENIDVKNEGE